jgi:hypothetical protein
MLWFYKSEILTALYSNSSRKNLARDLPQTKKAERLLSRLGAFGQGSAR